MGTQSEIVGLRELYGPEFFSAIADGSYASALHVWPVILFAVGTPKSVVDFGCGPGAWLAALRELASGTKLVGVDHPGAADSQMLTDRSHFVAADLRRSVDLGCSFDLCLSLEVAEHLPARCAATFVETLTRHADSIVFSAAIPGQHGTGHINEQWPSYWRSLFAGHGFRCVDFIRPALWMDASVALHYRQNTMLFVRSPATFPQPDWGGADLVHPEAFTYRWESGPVRAPRTPRNIWHFIRGDPIEARRPRSFLSRF